MRTVWIRHPVTRAESEVPASALPHWVGAGWEQFTPEPPPTPPARVEYPDEPDTLPTPRRRRRSTSTEDA